MDSVNGLMFVQKRKCVSNGRTDKNVTKKASKRDTVSRLMFDEMRKWTESNKKVISGKSRLKRGYVYRGKKMGKVFQGVKKMFSFLF